jgi:hypothetical protein
MHLQLIYHDLMKIYYNISMNDLLMWDNDSFFGKKTNPKTCHLEDKFLTSLLPQ